MIGFNLAQTFFIDPSLVKNSAVTYITSVDLYFGAKPSRGNTSTGLPAPGVTVYITPTVSNSVEQVPDTSIILGKSRVEYSGINVSTDSATATNFAFDYPIVIQTGRLYSVTIKFDGGDTGFALWRNKSSESVVDTNVIASSVSKAALDGKFYIMTNGQVPTPLNDTDLKLRIKVAKFNTTSKTYKIVNRNYEFVKYNTSSVTGSFEPGELVFANTGFPSAQTISVSADTNVVTGTSTKFQTTFAVGDYIVINSGTSNDIRRIKSISSDTVLALESNPSVTNTSGYYLVSPVARVYDYVPQSNTIVLSASTANSTVYLAAAQTLHGTKSGAKLTITSLYDFPVHAFTALFNSFVPPATKISATALLANSSYYTSANAITIDTNRKTEFRDFGAYIFSRSNEVQNATYLTGGKSANFNVTLSTNNVYTSPKLYENNINFFSYRYEINNDLTNENLPTGNATAKYISKPITLASGQDAEDLRVYATVFRPVGTDVKVYARLLNSVDSQPIDTKDWSPLEQVTPATLLSNPNNPRDFVEIEYKLPNYPIANSDTKSAGNLHEAKFSGSDGNNVLVGSTTTVNTYASANIQPNDVVRIYDALLPNNSLVATVTASNTSTFTIDTTLSSSNTFHTSFITNATKLNVEKVTYKNVAFNNYVNYGVVRYYDNNLGAHDTFKVFALKIVMTSNDPLYRPSVDNIRGIALTA